MIGNDGWESSATDIIGIHDYDANPSTCASATARRSSTEQLFDRRRPGGRVLTLDGYPHRGQPIMLTEFGGIAYARRQRHDRRAPGATAAAERPAEFARHVRRRCSTPSIHTALFSGFCYTQFADTFQEANGLLTADRTPKIPIERDRAGDPGLAHAHRRRRLEDQGIRGQDGADAQGAIGVVHERRGAEAKLEDWQVAY